MLINNQYPQYFLPESIWGYCSISCCMWILNYFRGTSFNGQNTRQMMNLFKEWQYSWEEMLDLPEIACKLDQLWFNIDYYLSYDKELHLVYVNKPEEVIFDWYPEKYHKFIKKWENWLYWDAWSAVCSLVDTTFDKKILENSSINSEYNVDMIETIQKEQWDWVLFLVWLDYYSLHNEEPIEWIPWWHVILVSKVENNDVVVFDPGPPLMQYWNVPTKKFMESVNDFWKYYSFMKITDKHGKCSSQSNDKMVS